MDAVATFESLRDRKAETPYAELDAFFDALPAVEETFMLGDWDGGVFRTGHVGERLLPTLAWVGKSFRARDDVKPIVSSVGGRRFANPVLGDACLRTVVYRGVATATMVYDRHPIFDHFRRVSDDVVLGAMDKKGDRRPLYFYLVRRS